MKNLLIPVAGKSERFPGMRKKWMLTHPNGNSMLLESVKGLNLEFFDNIYISVLREDYEQYNVDELIFKEFRKIDVNKDKIHIYILEEPTKSQPETIYKTIVDNNVEGFILIKDSDNYFELPKIEEGNTISIYDLNLIDSVNPRNKGYVTVDNDGFVNSIVEKKVVGSLFSCGGYMFKDVEIFKKYYNKVNKYDNIYLSHIYQSMILDDIPVKVLLADNYIDWGTLTEWDNYKSEYKTLFMDLDGVIVENSAEYFEPYWGETDALKENLKYLNSLYDEGKTQIIITTSRTEEYKEKTLKQLQKIGLKYHKIIFGLLHAKRIVVNDYSATNKYKTCDAINIKRNSDELKNML